MLGCFSTDDIGPQIHIKCFPFYVRRRMHVTLEFCAVVFACLSGGFLKEFMTFTLLTSGLIQGPYILKTEFSKPWETLHWPFICCVSEPAPTLSGSRTFRLSPVNMTPLSTLKKRKCDVFNRHKPSMMSSASIKTQHASTPISIKSSR